MKKTLPQPPLTLPLLPPRPCHCTGLAGGRTGEPGQGITAGECKGSYEYSSPKTRHIYQRRTEAQLLSCRAVRVLVRDGRGRGTERVMRARDTEGKVLIVCSALHVTTKTHHRKRGLAVAFVTLHKVLFIFLSPSF